MARFRCSACGREGEFVYDPLCGGKDVVFVLGIEELPDELVEALDLAEQDDEDENCGD